MSSPRDICIKCGLIFYPSGTCPRCEAAALRRRVAELEAERDRMRPVVDVAAMHYASLDEYAANPSAWNNGRVYETSEALRLAISAYLAATPKEPR